MLRDELREVVTWGERHRRLAARIILVLFLTVVVDALGTILIYTFERNAAHTDVHTMFDAFFFSTVQLLTVSSQLRNPVTTAGRIVDIVLEIWAVLVVAGFAGAMTSFFVAADAPRSDRGAAG